MNDLVAAFGLAGTLLASADAQLFGIVKLSLALSAGAVLCSTLIGLPLGALLGLGRFPGRRALIVVTNACMGMPPVVVGLFVYLLLSRSGPLGPLGWLFTPEAMAVAQVVLITPIVVALTRQIVEDLWAQLGEQLRSLGCGPLRAVPTLLWEGRWSLLTVVLAGFGRSVSEVGAIIIVGGNIAHVTRTMTTAIALETSKGDLPLALALGLILILIALLVNGAADVVRSHGQRLGG